MDEAPESNDDELVSRTQAGDPEAFDELVVRYPGFMDLFII